MVFNDISAETGGSLPPPITMGSPDALLAGFYRQILSEIGIDMQRIGYMASRATIRAAPFSRVQNISSMRSKLIQEILHPSMTFKVFLKSLSFISARDLELRFDLFFSAEHDVVRAHLPELRHQAIIKVSVLDEYLVSTKAAKPGKLLADVFKSACQAAGIVGDAFRDQLTRRTLAKKRKISGKKQSDIRNNDKKEFTADEMTWKVFFKGLEFLEIERLSLTAIVTHSSGRNTVHSLSIELHGDATE